MSGPYKSEPDERFETPQGVDSPDFGQSPPNSFDPAASLSGEIPIIADSESSGWPSLFADEQADDVTTHGAADTEASDEILDLTPEDSTGSHVSAVAGSGFVV